MIFYDLVGFTLALVPLGAEIFQRKMFGDGNHHSVVSHQELNTHDVWISHRKENV